MDIEKKAEPDKKNDNPAKNYDAAIIDTNAGEKNFEIEHFVDSLEEIAKMETTGNSTENPTEEEKDTEEKVEEK